MKLKLCMVLPLFLQVLMNLVEDGNDFFAHFTQSLLLPNLLSISHILALEIYSLCSSTAELKHSP